MRFTKIPLIATLMAVALSLLIVLPTLAQVSGDRTDGRLSVGNWIDVRVADKLTGDIESTATDPATTTVSTSAAYAVGATAYNAKDTYFGGDLYISNDAESDGAFNTILVTAAILDADQAADVADATVDEGPCDGVEAATVRIRNARSNTRVVGYLINSGSDETDGRDIYHGLVTVWDQEDSIEENNAACVAHGDPIKYVGSSDQDTDARADSAFPSAGTTEEQNAFIAAFVPEENEDGWTDASAAVIPARDGDVIIITVDGVSGSIRLVVDGEAPEIDEISPASGGTQNSTNVDLAFNVRDDGSGIRYDGESGDSGDPDLSPHNGDGDQRFDEPITSVGTGHTPASPVAGDGSTMDIQVLFDGPDDDATALEDVSAYGSNGWTQNVKGVSYDLDMRLVGQGFGKYTWQITAKDRVGNSVTTDADEDKPEDQPFSFNVDDDGPRAESARTGIGYEAGEGEFKSRSWIALNFINDEQGGADRIDASTVAPGDFTVKGHTVMNVVVPSDKQTCVGDNPNTDDDESAKNITAFDADDKAAVVDDADTDKDETADAAKGCVFEPRARIYLELSDELDSDETPTIQLLGGAFKDIAGNNNITDSIEDVQDKIAPGVGITITSSSGATGRTATDKKGTFTVRVTSDEELRTFPRLFFATIEGEASTDDGESFGAASNLTIDEATGGLGKELTEKETNVWEKTFKDADIVGTGDDRIVAVIVTAEDDASTPNKGNSAGWTDADGDQTPEAGEKLDFKKLDAGGFLLEIDSVLAPAKVVVLPSADPANNVEDETESTNPYIQITFDEPNEYGIPVTDNDGDLNNNGTPDADETLDPAPTAATGTSKSIVIKDSKPAKTDSHVGVEITAFTLNGEDRLAEVVQVDPWKYVLAVTGLQIGEYEITYAANDDVGNEVDEDEAEFTFEVLERAPYEVELQPGWNLISFPGDPFNPAVGNVIGSDLRADTVLGYQNGEWVTAVKNEDGRWQGTLVDIRGGYGYWVRTTAVESIETVIPPILPTSNLPTVPVVSGWNLLGVVDAEQRDAGTTEDADEYFTSLNVWRVAYSFQTQQNTWAKLLPDQTDGNVENGKGYWVWSTRPGTLVP